MTLFFWLLAAIFRTALPTIFDAQGVERSPDNMVANTGQVLHSTATHEHNRVLLQCVSFSRNIGSDLDLIRQTNASHLPQRRVRFLRRLCSNLRTNAALLRRTLGLSDSALFHGVKYVLQRRRFTLRAFGFTPFSNQLIYGWHSKPPST